jgi:hypothetical protein
MNKNRRSEWMKGLLFAEKMYKEGFEPVFPFALDGMHEWKNKAGSFAYQFNDKRTYEYSTGIVDYIQHYQRLQQC